MLSFLYFSFSLRLCVFVCLFFVDIICLQWPRSNGPQARRSSGAWHDRAYKSSRISFSSISKTTKKRNWLRNHVFLPDTGWLPSLVSFPICYRSADSNNQVDMKNLPRRQSVGGIFIDWFGVDQHGLVRGSCGMPRMPTGSLKSRRRFIRWRHKSQNITWCDYSNTNRTDNLIDR